MVSIFFVSEIIATGNYCIGKYCNGKLLHQKINVVHQAISPIGNQDYNRLFHPLPMISANHFSPLSFSPVGEMQVTPNCQRLVDTGYSELLKTGWCRLRTGWYMLLLLMCQTFYFIGIFVQFWARCLPTWGKHVAQHGQARCPTWAW